MRSSGVYSAWALVIAAALHHGEALRADLGTMANDSEDLACYCKQADMDKCPFEKTEKSGEKSFRWFHPGSDGEPNLCCKMSSSSIWTRKGFSYSKQSDDARCKSEIRHLPENVCCRLRMDYDDAKLGPVGLYVARVHFDADQRGKSLPYFELSDVKSGLDVHGQELNLEDVLAFLRLRVEQKRVNLHCETSDEYGWRQSTPSWPHLVNDTGTCHLLPEKTDRAQCCCRFIDLVESKACLKVEGAGQTVSYNVTANYSETEGEYYEFNKDVRWKFRGTHGTVTFPDEASPDQRFEADLPSSLRSGEPELVNTSLAEEKWTWSKAETQWDYSCEYKYVPIVESKYKSRYFGRRFGWIWGTNRKQTHESQCIEKKYTRLCPAGTAMYVKEIDPGQCISGHGDLALEKVDVFSYECPKELLSGDKTAAKYSGRYRNQRGDAFSECKCSPACQ